MSSVSQTPAARWVLNIGLMRLALFFGVLGVVLIPALPQLLRVAQSAHFHGPDLALFARLPVAIKIHLVAALVGIGLGAVLMIVRKGRTFHRTAGWVWVSVVAVVAGSSLFIRTMNHGQFSLLHVFTAWTLLFLPLAVLWAKRHDVARHRRTMMGLFYGGFAINLLVAFIPGRVVWQMFFG